MEDSMPVELWDRAQWQEFSAARPSPFFAQTQWFEPTCRLMNAEPMYLALMSRSNPAFCVSLARKKRLGQTLLLTPAIAPYSAWIENFPDDLAPERREARRLEAMGEFAAWCEQHAAYCRIVLPPQVVDVRPFLWRGWRTEVRYTYKIPLEHGVHQIFRQNVRRNLRDAREANLRTECLTGEHAHGALRETVAATFRRQGEAPPLPAQAWDDYLALLSVCNNVATMGVFRGDAVLATIAIGVDPPTATGAGQSAYELIAGTTDEGIPVGASAMALCSAFEFASGKVGEFDFAGANMETIAHYKRGFGGTLTPYLAVEWSRSRRASFVAKTAPAWKRKFRTLLPKGSR